MMGLTDKVLYWSLKLRLVKCAKGFDSFLHVLARCVLKYNIDFESGVS